MEPLRIGGWLYLPLLGLWFTPVIFLLSLLTASIQIAQAGSAAVIADRGWVTFIIVDLLFATASTGLALFILPKFHARKAEVPKLMKAMYALNIFRQAASLVGLGLLGELGGASGQAGSPVLNLAVPFIISLVWMSYFDKSERVRQTFIV